LLKSPPSDLTITHPSCFVKRETIKPMPTYWHRPGNFPRTSSRESCLSPYLVVRSSHPINELDLFPQPVVIIADFQFLVKCLKREIFAILGTLGEKQLKTGDLQTRIRHP